MAVRKKDVPGAARPVKRTKSTELIEKCAALLTLNRKRLANSSVLFPVRKQRKSTANNQDSNAGDGLSSSKFALGTALFGSLCFLAGSYPWVLPWLMVCFGVLVLPYRLYEFSWREPSNQFFLLVSWQHTPQRRGELKLPSSTSLINCWMPPIILARWCLQLHPLQCFKLVATTHNIGYAPFSVLQDFCYWVNLATCIYLIFPQCQSPQLEAAIYALADGPVAGALVVWQCAWVFSSSSHTISVLLHLLPGLAMYAQHHLPHLQSLDQLRNCASALRSGTTALNLNSCIISGASSSARAGLQHWSLWLLAAPLVFYAVWQAAYWLIVEVVCIAYIKRNQLDTSYKCLARRHSRADSFLGRFVLQGSKTSQILRFGLVQLTFTLITLLAFSPTYFSFHLAFLWQTIKFAVPIYHGAKYQSERLVKAAIAEGIRRYIVAANPRAVPE